MKLAYGYIRFSTRAQDRGSSTERQLAAIERHITNNGWELAETIKDLGKSAWKGENLEDTAGLGDFILRVKAGDIEPGSVLVVENIDRLSRKPSIDVFNFMQQLCEYDIRFAFAEGNKLFEQASFKDEKTAMLNVMDSLYLDPAWITLKQVVSILLHKGVSERQRASRRVSLTDYVSG